MKLFFSAGCCRLQLVATASESGVSLAFEVAEAILLPLGFGLDVSPGTLSIPKHCWPLS